jgi:hypothetical protein
LKETLFEGLPDSALQQGVTKQKRTPPEPPLFLTP